MAERTSDNVIHVSGSEEVREQNIRRAKEGRKFRVNTTLIIIVLILLVIGGVYIYSQIRTFNAIKVVKSSETIYEANAEYLEFGENLLRYTPDGVSYIDSNGDTVWTSGNDFKVPIAESSGNYAVVADKGGNLVAVFGVEGQISTVNMPYSICDIDVAKQGAFAAILESDETNFINMYDKNGKIIYEMQTSIDKSGYPMDISVSDDGKKLFTSYFKLDGVNIKNNLTAYNFGEVGQNENADRMVGGYSFEEEYIPKVEFVTNDIVAAFSDKEIILYNMKEKPSERGRAEYGGDISSIFYSSEYIGIIKPDSDGGSSTSYKMVVFDLSGKQSFEYAFSMDYDRIYADENEIIITGSNQCLIIEKGGRTRFSYTFDNMVKSMIPSSKTNEYIVTFENKTETIRLKTEDK
ncbi:MAG: hypothetical protein J5517_03810 [Eubacterium sp.]|nr:hypothetical protein [Eubacterium sp.]